MKAKTIRVPVSNTIHYLQIMSGLLELTGKGLTPTELEILSAFVDLKLEIKKRGSDVNPFSTKGKKIVAKLLGRDDFNTLNSYIKSLHDKGIIGKVSDGYSILPILIPGSEDAIVFKFKESVSKNGSLPK